MRPVPPSEEPDPADHHPPAEQPPEEPVLLVLPPGQSVEALRRDVMTGLAGRPHDVVIDLREVGSMSHLDLAVLVRARAQQRARGRSLTLVLTPQSETEAALQRTGLRGAFTARPAPPEEGPTPGQ